MDENLIGNILGSLINRDNDCGIGGGNGAWWIIILLLFLAVWAARRLGVSFEKEMFAQAHILRVFTTYTPLSVLSFLQ